MIMTDVFNKLKELQDILSEKYELEERIQTAPGKLSAQAELLERMKREFIDLNTSYEACRAAVAALKTELAEAEASREESEREMDNITTHREYETLDKKIKEASEKEQQFRRELQKEEIDLADLQEQLQQHEALLATQEAELNAGKMKQDAEIAGFKQQLELLNEQAAPLIEDIDPEIISKFERIIKSKHNKGIVAVKGNVCDGCHMVLPAQFANEVRSGEDIVFCPYCSRILYYQEADDDTQYFHMDDTGSLADLDEEDDEDEFENEEQNEEQDEVKDLGYDE